MTQENNTQENLKYTDALGNTISGSEENEKDIHVRRFDTYTRVMHIMIITSFLTLSVTGMIIKFSGVGVFQFLSDILGGYKVTGFLHRFAAIITFGYFALHTGSLFKKKKDGHTFKYMFTGENTMVPRKQDAIEFYQTIKWFLGLGPRPEYGRWTYWEKFDYFAVFWGVMVIGFSGLLLWFPAFFTSLGLPGEVINVATIIHSDEALLATGFIFTVHFFNTHFRPDKFPMDTVIFTGSMSLEEFKEDRPRQYKILKESGELENYFVAAPKKGLLRASRIFGTVALLIGLTTVLMIIYSMLFLYQ
ncbi:MAG: cytochrome b/b6 domain-containing protein [Bacteroidetes bacterium]|nr:cytochrome b/b6 domain-containing protein [Bacteroidota bacterium]